MSTLYDKFMEQLHGYNLGALSKEKREERIATCQTCEKFSLENTSCSICGCNVNWMVMFGPNSCMEGKWLGVPEPTPKTEGESE